MPRASLRERFFPLHQPAEVDRLLGAFEWCVVFKAGTSDKTFDAWDVAQKALEPRPDVAVGFIRLPEDRAASDHVSATAGIAHRSPQLILFRNAAPFFHLDELAILPHELVPALREHLPAEAGPRVQNEAVVTLEPYLRLLPRICRRRAPGGALPVGLSRSPPEGSDLARRRDVCAVEQPVREQWGRDVHAARLVALEFQGQLAGRLQPLKDGRAITG